MNIQTWKIKPDTMGMASKIDGVMPTKIFCLYLYRVHYISVHQFVAMSSRCRANFTNFQWKCKKKNIKQVNQINNDGASLKRKIRDRKNRVHSALRFSFPLEMTREKQNVLIIWVFVWWRRFILVDRLLATSSAPNRSANMIACNTLFWIGSCSLT